MFAAMRSERMEALHLFSDPATGLEAVVAIHNTRLGPALGGCRYLAYNSLDEAAMAQLRIDTIYVAPHLLTDDQERMLENAAADAKKRTGTLRHWGARWPGNGARGRACRHNDKQT